MTPDIWLGLELRHLIALKAIAEEGTFGRAAKRLGYTQSAISQQIAMLERIVGRRLIDRPGGPRPVSLTEAGDLLLRHADAIAARLQAAQADLAALDAGDAGPLRIGTYQSVGARVLPELLREFCAGWPQVDVTLQESADDRDLIRLVEQGDLDLSFVVMPLDPGPYEVVELFRDPYVLVVPAGSPLASRDRPPSLRELLDHPLISNRTCRTTQRVEDRLRQAGREPNIAFRSDDNGTVQGLVAAGVGVAVVPRLTVDETDPAVQVVDLGDRVPPRLIGIAWHRDRRRTRAADAFVELARTLTDADRRVGRSRLIRCFVAVGRRDAGDDVLLRALVEPLASALDRAQELVEVDLERGQDPVGPVLHLEARLAGLPPGVVDDLLRLPLRELDDLRLGGLARSLLARLAEDPVALPLRLGEHLLPLLDDPPGLLDLLRDGRAHLVEDVVDLLAVDAHLVREGHGLRVVHEVVELVDQYENVHMGLQSTRQPARRSLVGAKERARYSCGLVGAPPRPSGNSSRNLAATAGGTSSSTFPPKAAISFTPLEEMNE